MSCVNPSPPACGPSQQQCPDCFGCSSNQCYDFQIKRYDTQPSFRVSVAENGEPIDLTGLVIEANMWASAKLKHHLDETDTSLCFADNIGFCQVAINDTIVVAAPRSPEQMRITGFDENKNIVFVERGINGTMPRWWKRGTGLRIFRIINAPALSEMVYGDTILPDGTPVCEVLQESDLVYEWSTNDTCQAGCFSFEFKVLQFGAPIVDPPPNPACFTGFGVLATRRYPTCGSFSIHICNSPTAELFVPPSTT